MNRLGDEVTLPECWIRPTSDMQRTLFSDSTDQALAALKVSCDDVRRWQSHGWISFDIDDTDSLDWSHASEIEFVRNVARSGLLDAQIDSLLESLPKPYRFSSQDIAYHFTLGWVAPARDDPFDVIENNLNNWLDHLAGRGEVRRLEQIVEQIAEQLEELDSEEESE